MCADMTEDAMWTSVSFHLRGQRIHSRLPRQNQFAALFASRHSNCAGKRCGRRGGRRDASAWSNKAEECVRTCPLQMNETAVATVASDDVCRWE